MSFDANAFMAQPAAPLKTTYEVVPEREYKMSTTDDLKVSEIEYTDKHSGERKVFHQMELTCKIHDDALAAQLNRKEVTVRMRIPLDIGTDGKLENGANKNIRLGQLRDALGQNNDGWIPANLKNAGPFIGKVSHTSDKKDPSIKYADVTKVSKIAA